VSANQPLALRLDKQIPIAAGLGGGSADAAAGLQLARRYYSADAALVTQLAPTLGSDVPFCAVGGTATVRGRGEIIDVMEPILGYGLAVVVPPVELATPRVYGGWDELGGPTGPEIQAKDLPPVLRGYGPLGNDLYPAAVALAPLLDDWRAQLSDVWGRPVAMSGSGASLYGFFMDEAEAASALRVVPPGARASHAASPLAGGWEFADDET
jgi:4-diphosphocytidyl-2-C-methyl-D-erythritol kinase